MERIENTGFTWKDWIKIIPCIILLCAATDALSLWTEQSLFLHTILLGAFVVAVWGVYFWQRKRHPVLAETAALMGVLGWLVACNLLIDQLRLSAYGSTFQDCISLCIIPLPFLTRQRFIIALSLALIGALFLRLSLDSVEHFPIYLSPLLVWLLSEWWRATDSKFKVYAWVGVPAFLLMWLLIPSVRGLHFSSILLGVGAPLLLLLLRPCGGRPLPLLLIIATCLLPLLHANSSKTLFMLAMLVYAGILFYSAVRSGRRHWFTLGYLLLIALVFLLCEKASFIALFPILIFAGVGAFLLHRWVKRHISTSEAEQACAPFPAARWQLALVGLLAIAQPCSLIWLYCASQAELQSAPRITMQATWEPSMWQATRMAYIPDIPLHICHDEPVQDSPFFGKSLWWTAEGLCPLKSTLRSDDTDKEQRPLAPRPQAEGVSGAAELTGEDLAVAAFLRPGEDELWHIARIEARDSSEDAAQPGEVRVLAKLRLFKTLVGKDDTHPGEIICMASCKLEIKAPHLLEEQRKLLSEYNGRAFIAVEIALRQTNGPFFSRISVNGRALPLRIDSSK